MSSSSDRAIRIRSIPQDNADEAFANFKARLASAPTTQLSIFTRSSRASAEFPTLASLARQQDENVGTISFSSKQLKEKALKDRESGWILDDQFNGITVLHSPPNPDLEYVFLNERRCFACTR
jgi:hypothetical protein